MSDEEAKTFHLYVDETSKSASFMGVGALFARRDSGREIARMVQAAVPAHGQRPNKEIHWSELTNHLLPLYTAVGAELIRCTQVKPYRMRCHVMMIERSKLDRSINAGLNREEILARFIFMLIFQFASNFGPYNFYHVFVDSPDGEERGDLALRAMLNNRCFSHFGVRTDPFRSVRYVRSENSRLIQAVILSRAPSPMRQTRSIWQRSQRSTVVSFGRRC